MQHELSGYGGSNDVNAIFVTWPDVITRN